ncbi:MAG: LysE family translocator, partial [Desulfomonilaceae bacterium]
MALTFFAKGLLVGFILAIPVGPIGLLCITRSLARGRISGIFSGLGAATADAVYAFVAGFGVTYISSFLMSHQVLLRLAGGAVLVLVGLHIALTKPPSRTKGLSDKGLLGDYVSVFFLTLT